MYYTVASFLFNLLAITHATPAWPNGVPRGTPPPKSSQFSLAMNMSGYLVPLTAAYFESRGVLLKGAGTHDPDPETHGTFLFSSSSDCEPIITTNQLTNGHAHKQHTRTQPSQEKTASPTQ